MPDITMCSGVGCPQKEQCYRFKATPTPGWQSYFAEPPVKEDGSCEAFAVLRRYPQYPIKKD